MHLLSDECSKLPDIQNLETTAQFPVSYNTPVAVHCDIGYSLMGGDVIICIRGATYRSIQGQLPSCKESEFIIATRKKSEPIKSQL